MAAQGKGSTRSRSSRASRRRGGALHRYFIPGAHNSYRPHALRLKAVSVIAVVVVLLFIIALAIEQLVIRSPSPQVASVVVSVLVELANADRAENGLETLSENPTLAEAAQLKAEDMAAKSYFAHESPGGFSPWHWFEKAGYGFRYAGENLAVYFSDSSEVEKAWMNSPSHRANILSEKYSEIGIALAHGRYEGYETTFVVQMFGTPAEATAAVVESREPVASRSDVVAGASASAEPIGALKGSQISSMLWRLFTAPKTMLQYAYLALAALVLLAVSLLFLAELRRLHVPSFLRGVGLLVLIGVLLWGGLPFFSGELLVL